MKKLNHHTVSIICGTVAALIIFVAVHLVLGKDGDGNLVVFGVPALASGLLAYFIVR